mgnify:CR=1 FL=1
MESLNDFNDSLFNALDEFKQTDKDDAKAYDEDFCINCEKNTYYWWCWIHRISRD